MKRIRTSLTKSLFLSAIALTALSRAIAHTNDPSLYILYAQADQVDWANLGAASWSANYVADPLNVASLNVLVGAFIDTGGTNTPPLSSERVRGTTYNFFLTDVTHSNRFTVLQGIVATNGLWAGLAFSTRLVDRTIDASGNYGPNVITLSGTNSVAGDNLSSALQISLDASEMQPGDTLTFQPGYPCTVNYADGSVHRAGQDPGSAVNLRSSGSITLLPEPSTSLLIGPGLVALLGRRLRKTR